MPGLTLDLGHPVDWSHPLNRGRVLWLYGLPHLAGGGTWRDLCGAYGATITSGATWAGTPHGHAGLTFTAPDVPFARALTLGASDSAIAFTFRATAAVTDKHVVGSNGTGNRIYWISNTSLRVQGNGTSVQWTVPDASDGLWQRYCVTRQGGNTRVFVNGAESSLGAQAHAQAVALTRVGANSSAGGNPLPGVLADVTAWSGVTIPDPAGFAFADYDLSRRGYSGVLRRVRPRASFLVSGGAVGNRRRRVLICGGGS